MTAEAERCAFNRPASWSVGDHWLVETQAVMNRVWVSERLIRLMFTLAVHEAARAYFLALNLVVWEGLPDGESVRDYLEANRLAFLDAARVAVAFRAAINEYERLGNRTLADEARSSLSALHAPRRSAPESEAVPPRRIHRP